METLIDKKRPYEGGGFWLAVEDVKDYIKKLKPLIDKYVDMTVHKMELADEINKRFGEKLI